MWALVVLALALALAAGAPEADNGTAVEERPFVARGKLLTVPVKELTADEISGLLDSLGFYMRSQKGEEVPEEFQHFPLRAPRDEL
ncbi:putative selenoprotein M-like [Scophthalmus maximus]|uniref:Putative selenoprotein M-like n=1 Tax=Scophthalmus maximus TaxID=52904 RepID=A0A2U9BVL6_SCOMX|nr:putative selenoprotein M-like [Scophthalmus maximus]